MTSVAQESTDATSGFIKINKGLNNSVANPIHQNIHARAKKLFDNEHIKHLLQAYIFIKEEDK